MDVLIVVGFIVAIVLASFYAGYALMDCLLGRKENLEDY